MQASLKSRATLLVLTLSILGQASATGAPPPTVAPPAMAAPALCKYQSSAVAVARSHIEAWSRKDWSKAQALLSPDVHVTVMTTTPGLKPVDTTGPDAYMTGLKKFADQIIPNSTHVIAALGNQCNALVMVTSKMSFAAGAPSITIHQARLYLLDDSGKIKTEQVVFY